MLEFILIIPLLVFFVISLWLCFINSETSQFLRELKTLIKLLRKMGYYPKQILNILDFYDWEHPYEETTVSFGA